MKANHKKQTISKILILILITCIIFAGCSNEILAPNSKTTSSKYVSIGDSIAAGFALPSYEKDGNKAKESYAYLFSEKTQLTEYIDLAVTGFDTKDVLNSIPEYINKGYIKNASVITIALGSNDILGPSLELMCKAAGVLTSEELLLKFENLSKSGKKLDMLYLLGSIWNSLSSNEAKELLSNQVNSYKENIINIIDILKKESPNAKIYLINYYNPYKGFAFGSLDVGAFVAEYLDEMNSFINAHEYNGIYYHLVDIQNLTNEYTNVSLDANNMALDPHPNTKGHEAISDALYNVYSEYNDKTAILEYLDNSTEKEYFSSISESFNKANTILDKDIKITLLSDWISDVSYLMGTGLGFSDKGTICPVDRKNNSKLVLDLNGHEVNRCLPAAISGGEVFELRKDGTYIIKNGTITGGNNKSHGGAFWIDNDETTVYLENLIISGNKASKNGAGIYIKDCNAKITLTDCLITENTSSGYGGALYLSDGGAKVTLQGLIKIFNNKAKSQRENLCIQRTGWFNTGYPTIWVGKLNDASDIHFNVSSNDITRSVFYVDENTLSKEEANLQYESFFTTDSTKLNIKLTTELDGSKKYKRYALELE